MEEQNTAHFLQIKASAFKKQFAEAMTDSMEKDPAYKTKLMETHNGKARLESHFKDIISSKFGKIMTDHNKNRTFTADAGTLKFEKEDNFTSLYKDICQLFLFNAKINGVDVSHSESHQNLVDCDITVNSHGNKTMQLHVSESVHAMLNNLINTPPPTDATADDFCLDLLFPDQAQSPTSEVGNRETSEDKERSGNNFTQNEEKKKMMSLPMPEGKLVIDIKDENIGKRKITNEEETIAESEETNKKKRKKTETFSEEEDTSPEDWEREILKKKKKEKPKKKKKRTTLPDNEQVRQKGFRTVGCDADTLLRHISAHTADYVKEGRQIFEENVPKIINSCKAVWSFTKLLEKLLARMPYKLNPETKQIEIPCTGCPLHCLQHFELPAAPGRPPKDPLLNLQPSLSTSSENDNND